jgi:hypothetical protein
MGYYVTPFQGSVFLYAMNPGLQPGLLCRALSGLSGDRWRTPPFSFGAPGDPETGKIAGKGLFGHGIDLEMQFPLC